MKDMEVAAGRPRLDSFFSKRECQFFVPNVEDLARCVCGQKLGSHRTRDIQSGSREDVWNPTYHTRLSPTDAYGAIEFQDGAHPSKAQYIRLAFDTRADHVMQLLTRQWGVELPKLVISVHGGSTNFNLPTKLSEVFKKGLLKAAKTTGAWILTGGTNAGVTKHVGDALSSERSPRLRPGRVVSIGIAPWGIVENRSALVVKGKDVPYMSLDKSWSETAYLNSRHAYFLFADNGTVGQKGHEMFLRRRLEKIIASQKLQSRIPCNVPVICLVIEGGLTTIKTVMQYVTDTPPVPVVVMEGSGKAADLIVFACKYIGDDDTLCDRLHEQVIETIMKMFSINNGQAKIVFGQLLEVSKKKNLISIFRVEQAEACVGDATHQLDYAILTALLRSHHLTAQQKLSLALAWNRDDLARREIFTYGQSWPDGALDEAMFDALAHNRVEFVKLLLEKGVSMTRFLTVSRLEELYNSHGGPANTLRYLVADVRPKLSKSSRITLHDIGLVINKLMGGAYRCSLSSRKFRQFNSPVKKISLGQNVDTVGHAIPTLQAEVEDEFSSFPFNELLIWSVLTKRQSMALLMWQQGEEALAKSLAACCLYRSMAKEAAEDDLEAEVCEELRKYATDFENISLELVDYCYRRDDDITLQLLTCSLPNWSRQTCLHLAVVANLKSMLSHPSAQILLADLWMGGLRTRKSPNLKVFLALLCPPVILKLEFKSEEELLLMPQTEEEHLYEAEDEEEKNKDEDSETENGPTSSHDNISGDIVTRTPQQTHRTSRMSHQSDGNVATAAQHVTGKKILKQLNLRKKLYEFYGAPITKFWAHSMAYVVFLCMYTYTVLIRSRPVPEWNEIYVLIYFLTFGLEKVREIAASDGVTI